MEWVVTNGRTVEQAKDLALDQLGVDEQDAEFEILEEPRTGLFGRLRGEAKVRARVRPTQPRPKVERRPRRRSSGARRDSGAPAAAAERRVGDDAAADGEAVADTGGGGGGPKRRPRRGGAGTGRTQATPEQDRTDGGEAPPEGGARVDATVEQQAEITKRFLSGLLEAFDVDADIDEVRVDDETIELQVQGSDLGLLVGHKGQTIQALHELSRTVVQREATGTHHGRVRIDVAGYRQRRKEALERFARQVAEDVRNSGVAKALEPMHAGDRKIVHDTINEIDGVATSSEGEESRRHVVIRPDAG